MLKPTSLSPGHGRFISLLAVILLVPAALLQGANVMVTFRVNMKNAYTSGGVYVGSDWAGWSLEKFQLLTDTNHDSIFETTIYLPAGESYNYRYTKGNANWGGFESLTGSMCGSGSAGADRNIVVPASNTVLPVVCFNECADCGTTPNTMLSLSVDMSGVAVSAQGLHVAGSFNNWNCSSHTLTDADNDHIYTITLPLLPNLAYEYKFVNGNSLTDAEVVFGSCEFRSRRRVNLGTDSLVAETVAWGSCSAVAQLPAGERVACIGNSITEGGAGNYFNSWSVQLADMLGEGWYTENLGVAGTTMSKTGDKPWWNEPQYAYTFALQPGVVLIKLGTNDSKSSNWKPANYKADYLDMIDKLRAMPSQPELYMVTPCKAYSGAYNISDNTIVMKLIPVLHQIAREKGVHLIDMYNATSYMPALFPDGIHPNAAGAKVIAQKVKDNLLKAKPLVMQVEPTTDTTTNSMYQWMRNGEPIAGANRRTLNATENGTYRVVVKMSSGSNDIYVSQPFELQLPQGTTTVGLTTDYEVTYGLGENPVFDALQLYPNPSSGSLTLTNAAGALVSLLTPAGQLLATYSHIGNPCQLNLQGFSDGLYMVKITLGKSSVTRQVLLKRE